MRKFLIALINFYKAAISPHLPSSCRFYPTCSDYGRQAIEKYGSIRGSFMALKRLLRCGPWSKGGFDPLK
ncbi:MAG: membrane protein insertion efficiency factor YidD [Candidatus Goldiibacteriota bacterium]|jgi:putative membrane protein insertion efficiency factor